MVRRYVRPSFVGSDQPPRLHIVQGRHPVLDMALESTVVPNDTHLTGQGPRALVITGPNMGGKSCYMRQAALIAIMAQVTPSAAVQPSSAASLPCPHRSLHMHLLADNWSLKVKLWYNQVFCDYHVLICSQTGGC